jgi:cytoskeletal protein RodZ
MSASTPAGSVDLIGWRKRNGVSLSAIAAATKISLRYLEAIERGKFNVLPGGAYGVNYVRQYAEAIHYDAGMLVEQYREETAEPELPPVDTLMQRVWRRVCSLA